MNTALVDFLNHGLLPFVGRATEVDRIEAFWRAAAESQGLRSMLMVGEAGAGKSRLVEEAGSLVARQRGLVIHTRLYPESTTALAPLLARAIMRAAGATGLVRTEPEGTLPAVAAALRRLSRLRRTLIVVEDVHLLARESLHDFSILLDNVADDSLALLCCSRTESAAACAVLERHLVEELRLSGFDRRGLETLLTELFGPRVDRSLVEPLLEATRGNVLAVRSALRGAIRRSAIGVSPTLAQWQAMVPRAELATVLAESVRTLAEGMAVHLEEAERRYAAEIAPLGEIFARRTAARLVDESIVDGLVFKGVLTRSTAGATLLPATESGGTLLAFTHTLIHNYFLEMGAGDLASIVAIVADGAPLYSAMAFHRIVAADSLESIEPELLLRAVRSARAIASGLNKTSDWELAAVVLDAGDRMLAACRDALDAEVATVAEVQLLSGRLGVLSRQRGPDFQRLLEHLLAITENPTTFEMRSARLVALTHKLSWAQRNEPELCGEIDEEAEALVAVDPDLAITPTYDLYLRGAIGAARGRTDIAEIRRLEGRYHRIIDDPRTTPETMLMARVSAATYLLDLFESEADLDRRLAEFEELMSAKEADVQSMKLHRTIAWYEAGRLAETAEAIAALMPHFRDRGWRRTVVQCQFIRICTGLLLGEDPSGVPAAVEAIMSENPASFRPMIATSIVAHVAADAELAGHCELARGLRSRYHEEATTFNDSFEATVALVDGEPIDVSSLDLTWIEEGSTRRILAPDHETLDATVDAFRHELRIAPYRLDSLRLARLFLVLIRHHDRLDPTLGLERRLAAELRAHAIDCIEWLMRRRLWYLAGLTLKTFADVIGTKEARELEKRINRSTPATPSMPMGAGDDRIRISMLGAIEIARPGVEPVRPKGARLRMLLGVLSADAMLERHLSNQEFYRLAAEERDIDRARKAVYVAIHRLRDTLGSGAIVTDGETPRLDMSLVRVDLVEASSLLRDAQAASLDGAWLRASTSLLATLEIARGEVPFPGLYDDYFEGAREDFEGMLRSTVVRVARGLMSEGDPETAEEVLRRATAAMPEDEDLAELHCDALVALGRRAEAERVRRSAELEVRSAK